MPVSFADTTKCHSKWQNLYFLESLGSKEWEKHKARTEFKHLVKQCHLSVGLLKTVRLLETLE